MHTFQVIIYKRQLQEFRARFRHRNLVPKTNFEL
jgi:hypothetical protein